MAFLAAELALMYEGRGVAVEPAEQQGLRLAIVAIALFLLVGLLIVLTVNEKRARADAATSDLVIAVS